LITCCSAAESSETTLTVILSGFPVGTLGVGLKFGFRTMIACRFGL